MNIVKTGIVTKGVGGLYETRVASADTEERIVCRAKGVLRREEEKLAVGDRVEILLGEQAGETVISRVFTRRNLLIRPPLSNVDFLFVCFAAEKPAPVFETVDKLIAIAEYHGISPVIVLTKADLARKKTEEYAAVYRTAGFPVFVTSSKEATGTDGLCTFVEEHIRDEKIAAFAGASGVGKSSIMNLLFPGLSLATSEISKKAERGRHTTRHVELFPLGNGAAAGFVADTPGFSLLDFGRFDFFSLSDLPATFREFAPYLGKCRYADCSHVGEGAEECAVLRAATEGKIAASRLESYRSIYRALKKKESAK